MIEYVSFGQRFGEGAGTGWVELPVLLTGRTGGYYIDRDEVILTGLAAYASGGEPDLKVFVNDDLIIWEAVEMIEAMGRMMKLYIPLKVSDRIRLYTYISDIYQYISGMVQLQYRR